tara:strand:- start:2 stop:544 length:543 start_codon:yes stop_codon:yes gene_type:complete
VIKPAETEKGFRMNNDFNTHDIDKLNRWRSDFNSLEDELFPVYAVFILIRSDSDTQKVFRVYRDVFDTLKAHFRNLVIFGQHGFSSVARELAATLGLVYANQSSLLIFGTHGEEFAYEVAMGDTEDSTPAWTVVLENIRNLVNGVGNFEDIGDINGVTKKPLHTPDVTKWLDHVLESVSN